MANSNPLPSQYRFDWGDYQGLGPIFQKFLANLNLFTVAIYQLINGGIGFANLQRTIYTTTITAAVTTPMVFVNPLPIQPSGLNVVKIFLVSDPATPLTSSVSVANWTFDGKNINVLNITGLTSGHQYKISVEIC